MADASESNAISTGGGSSSAPGIKDVAAHAGVSWKTVTNVVHGRTNVRPQTRDRVLESIRHLGYRPNLAGRALRQGRTGTILLATQMINSPYFGGLAETLIEHAEASGLTVLIEVTGGDLEREMLIAEGARHRSVDGIIFNPVSLSREQFATARDATPMVLLGEHLSGVGVPHVCIDNEASAREMTRHFLDAGARSVAFVGAPSVTFDGTGGSRYLGFRAAMNEAGLEIEPQLLFTALQYSREEGRQIGRAIANLVTLPDAVLCVNDLLAMGILKELRDAGVEVPGRVQVAGWDNSPEGEYMTPSLTTIAPDVNAVVREALSLLRACIADRSAALTQAAQREAQRQLHQDVQQEVQVAHRLIRRGSTLAAQPAAGQPAAAQAAAQE